MNKYFKEDYDPENLPDPEAEGSEEREIEAEERKSRWIMTESMLNFLAVVAGVILIILFTALLFSIVKWLQEDVHSTFSLLTDRFNQPR